jgi:membrane-bound lytic murein transglycosylase D
VPDGKGELLLSKLNESSVSKFSQKLYDFHEVQSGETLTQLAGRYRTSVQAIADINHIREKDFLQVGQKLKIPLGRTKVSKESEIKGQECRGKGPVSALSP